ncbi:hypothetical protein [Bacillus sp. mrc49]|uniref:hypothetical protein n=1 Tax=Bacillus sp. mrc49 TaxID=2054913 RepID=UPI000C270CB3|nr:hypothetical protein [Bacillus sp. mrc49]PJN91008.1 hypothetical protein CVN76_07410 [Bacillus sp. mrc49]
MKIEAIKYSDYMGGQRFEEKKTMNDIGGMLKKAGVATAGAIMLVKAPLALAAVEAPQGLSVPASAVSGAVKQQVIHAFDPLVDLMMSLSLPIASVIITGAALMILMGFKEKGYPMMFSASIGYCLVQLTPMFIKILAGVGGAI